MGARFPGSTATISTGQASILQSILPKENYPGRKIDYEAYSERKKCFAEQDYISERGKMFADPGIRLLDPDPVFKNGYGFAIKPDTYPKIAEIKSKYS